MNRKRIIFIGTGILALVGILIAGYLFRAQQNVKPGESPTGGGLPFFSTLFSKNTSVTPGSNNSEGGSKNGGSSGTGTQGGPQLPKLVLVAPNPVLAYFVDKDGNVALVQPDGQIFSVVGGSVNAISNAVIPGLIDASFSYDGRKILLKTGTEELPQWSVFDITTKNSAPLTSDVRSVSWSPNDYRIAYLAQRSPGVLAVTTLDLAAKTPKPATIITLHEQDMNIVWPGKDRVALHGRASAFVPGSLYTVDLKKKTVGIVARDVLGLTSLWNSSGSKALAFFGNANNRGGTLKILSENGVVLHALALTTLPSKCAFNNSVVGTGTLESMICAVPRDAGAFIRNPLPDAYQKKDAVAVDNVLSFDLASGAIFPVFNDPAGEADVSLVRANGSKFFFVNRRDQKLYYILLTVTAQNSPPQGGWDE